EASHHEKEELLPAGLQTSPYVQVDDTGARHQGQTGYCTHIGNDLFAYFASTDSKSRLNFLEVLRRPHTDYVVNEVAVAYWRRQGLAAALVEALGACPGVFADPGAWQGPLEGRGGAGGRPGRDAPQGGLPGH